MIYQGKELAGDFQFVFTDEMVIPQRADAFTVFANIVEQDEYFVTVARYQNFGKLRISDITISKWDFNDVFFYIHPQTIDEKR